MRKRRVSTVLFENWQPVVGLLLAIASLLTLYLIGSTSTAPTVQSAELQVLGSEFSNTLSNPLHLHQQLIQRIAGLVGIDTLYAVRLGSAVSATIASIALFCILRAWSTVRMALLGTVLFSASSWVLHVARIGLPDANYLLLTLPVLSLIMLSANKYSLKGSLLLIMSSVMLLYIPGLLWFIVPALLLRRKLLVQTIKNLPPAAIGGILLYVVFGVLPFIIAVASNPAFILEILAVPRDISTLTQAPQYVLSGLASLFVTRDANPLLGIAHLPYVSIATAMLIFLGMVHNFNERNLDRSKAVFAICIAGILLHGVSLGVVSLSLLTPFLLVFATDGVIYMLRKWLTVFPRNKLAEKTAVILVLVVVASISAYETTKYFIAWPHSDSHAQIFTQN